MSLDLAILKFLNSAIANPALDLFFKYLCDFDIWRWPVAIVIIVLLWKGGPKGRWLVALALMTALVVDPAIYRVFKPLIGRLRPCHEEALVWLRLIDGCGGLYGFPSSHAANFFSQAVIVGSFHRVSRYFLFPVAFFVAVGRVYLGVHYPSDVLAGAAFGTVVAVAVIFLANLLAPEKIGRYFHSLKNGK